MGGGAPSARSDRFNRVALTELRVLLLSPLPELDPPGGDVTYTEELLESPPPGVVYETYAQALAEGSLVELGRRNSLNGVLKRELPISLAMIGREHAVNALRSREILFREPFRYFDIKSPGYDLVHDHVYSVFLRGAVPPVLLSNGAAQPNHYRDGRHWSRGRTKVAVALDRGLAFSSRVIHNSLAPTGADRLVCFSQHLKNWYVSEQGVKEDLIDVIPCGISAPASRSPKPERLGPVVGFVAADFDLKGGGALLNAWPAIRSASPNSRLVIVGSEPRLPVRDLEALSIDWIGKVPRQRLFSEIMPAFDVFAYPTNWDGAPLIVEESLAHGIPTVVSDYGALPEMIGFGRAGEVVPRGDARALASAVLRLLQPDRNRRVSAQAVALFEECYEVGAVHQRLRKSYDAVLARDSDRAHG